MFVVYCVLCQFSSIIIYVNVCVSTCARGNNAITFFLPSGSRMAKFPGQDLFDGVVDLVKEYLTLYKDRDSKVILLSLGIRSRAAAQGLCGGVGGGVQAA